MNKSLIVILIHILSFLAATTSARADGIYEYPTNWRLQSYLNTNAVMVYFTSVTSCTYGGLMLATTDQDQKGRFWSLVLTAKASNKRIGIFYTGCNIDSFYIDN